MFKRYIDNERLLYNSSILFSPQSYDDYRMLTDISEACMKNIQLIIAKVISYLKWKIAVEKQTIGRNTIATAGNPVMSSDQLFDYNCFIYNLNFSFNDGESS